MKRLCIFAIDAALTVLFACCIWGATHCALYVKLWMSPKQIQVLPPISRDDVFDFDSVKPRMGND